MTEFEKIQERVKWTKKWDEVGGDVPPSKKPKHMKSGWALKDLEYLLSKLVKKKPITIPKNIPYITLTSLQGDPVDLKAANISSISQVTYGESILISERLSATAVMIDNSTFHVKESRKEILRMLAPFYKRNK